MGVPIRVIRIDRLHDGHKKYTCKHLIIKKENWKVYLNRKTPEKYELFKTEKKVKELIAMFKKKIKEFID